MGEVAEMMLAEALNCEPTASEMETLREIRAISEKPTHALRGDWAVIGRWVGSGREQRKPARAALGWSKRKLGGIICAMEEGGPVMTGGPEFWLTARGLAALEATR